MVESIEIDNRKIVIKGIGKLLYQEGLPIGISIVECNKKGYEVSWFHIADELLKEGWKPDAIIARIREDIEDDSQEIDIDKIEKFVYTDYETQREMIFKYLFSSEGQAKSWLNCKING